MTPITREQAAEPARYEFQAKDGTWHPFLDQKHYENTKADGRWPIRALYTREQVIADLARRSGAMPLTFNVAGNGSFNGFNACTENDVQKAIASLQAKLEQSEARVSELEAKLVEIGDYAHDRSTGPAVPDALWEIRSMAYEQGARP